MVTQLLAKVIQLAQDVNAQLMMIAPNVMKLLLMMMTMMMIMKMIMMMNIQKVKIKKDMKINMITAHILAKKKMNQKLMEKLKNLQKKPNHLVSKQPLV